MGQCRVAPCFASMHSVKKEVLSLFSAPFITLIYAFMQWSTFDRQWLISNTTGSKFSINGTKLMEKFKKNNLESFLLFVSLFWVSF